MPCLLYAIGLVVCGAAISVQCHIARWGSEDPDWFGWPGVVVGAGMVVVELNLLGFVALAVLGQHAQSRPAQALLFLVGLLSGLVSGIGTSWLLYGPSFLPFPLFLILVFAQAPLVVMIINWLLGRLTQPRRV